MICNDDDGGKKRKGREKKREKANYKSGFLELCGILYSTGPHQLTAEAGRDSNQVLLIHSIHLIDFIHSIHLILEFYTIHGTQAN